MAELGLQIGDRRPRRRPRLLVLGIGNALASDDGVGVHVVRELRRHPRAGVLVTETGTAILDALPLLAWADRVVVIDALRAGRAPGTIYWTRLAERGRESSPFSLHELDLSRALTLLPPDRARPEIWVVAVEPERLGLGLDLSPAVRAAVSRVATLVNQKLAQWRSTCGGAETQVS